MKHQDFDQASLLPLISEILDGSLDDAGREALNSMLRESEAARQFFRDHMELHASLHLDYNAGEVTQFLPSPKTQQKISRFPSHLTMVLAAAACIALLVSLFWPRKIETSSFATLESSSAARWDSSDLPTRNGARLGKGTLRLAEGLATLRFDSGAQVILEAPVSMTIVDAMSCMLGSGIAVADIPQSALGFRIATPSANVVDYGTRFSVKVDLTAGRTQTHVIKGLVEVEHPATGAVVALKAGQMNSADKSSVSEAREWSMDSSWSGSVGPAMRAQDWTVLETNKDAYIGDAMNNGVRVPRSETLLLVKRSTNPHVERKAYLGFDLTAMNADRMEEAEFTMHFAPTGLGLASDVPDATFIVYGMLTNEPWDEKSIRVGNAPVTVQFTRLDKKKVRELGRFQVKQGVQSGEFSIKGEALVGFLRERAGSSATLIVARDTLETQVTGLVHGFASRRHPTLPAPMLAIRNSVAAK